LALDIEGEEKKKEEGDVSGVLHRVWWWKKEGR